MPHYTYISARKYTSKSGRRTSHTYQAPCKPKMVSEGSSITYGVAANADYFQPMVRSYPSYFGAVNLAQPYTFVANCANAFRSGRVDAEISGNSTVHSTAVFTYLPEDDLYFLVSNSGLDTYLSSLSSYLDDRKAAGFTVVLCTSLPRSDVYGSNTWNEYWRNLQNNAVMSWVGSHCDSVCDFGGIPELRYVSNTSIYTPWHLESNSTFSNGVFPTDYAHKLLADKLRSHIETQHQLKF